VEKKDVTVDVVVALLRDQFPQWADLPVRPVDVDGAVNSSFRLGDELVVRLPSQHVLDAEKEHRWLPTLAKQLPMPIPEPVAKGWPSSVFPRVWSIYRWLEGDTADHTPQEDRVTFALDVAAFLGALYRIDARGGPAAGEHSFWRGGPLTHYDQETRNAIADLGDAIDTSAATSVWDAAMDVPYTKEPVWVHGDVAPGNLLVREGRLSAVIDFGASAVGDPACDTVLAWTFLDGESRRAFRQHLPVDHDTWVRGRGWAIWWALYILAWYPDVNPPYTRQCQRVLADIIAEHRAGASPESS
jgi:aminoglycoside phosphotransferase (APT) family kinase protein